MPFPGEEATVGQATWLNIECGDCGRQRFKGLADLEGFGITADAKISEVATRLRCTDCREDGMPGRNITVSALFRNPLDRIRAEAVLIKTREARRSARPARYVGPRKDRT